MGEEVTLHPQTQLLVRPADGIEVEGEVDNSMEFN
jgi:hypothetical protein